MSNLLNRGNERNRPGMRRVQRQKILRDVERKRMQDMGKLFCRHVRLSGRVTESEPRVHRVCLWKVYKCIKLGRVPEMDRVQWAGRKACRGDRIVGSCLRIRGGQVGRRRKKHPGGWFFVQTSGRASMI